MAPAYGTRFTAPMIPCWALKEMRKRGILTSEELFIPGTGPGWGAGAGVLGMAAARKGRMGGMNGDVWVGAGWSMRWCGMGSWALNEAVCHEVLRRIPSTLSHPKLEESPRPFQNILVWKSMVLKLQ